MIFPAASLPRALRSPSRGDDPVCLICQRPVRTDEQRLRLRGETYVHSRCATYRVRNVESGRSRLGYPD